MTVAVLCYTSPFLHDDRGWRIGEAFSEALAYCPCAVSRAPDSAVSLLRKERSRLRCPAALQRSGPQRGRTAD